MAASPRTNSTDQKADTQSPERLTLLERAIDRAIIDVAACIRWFFIGIALVIGALYPFFGTSIADTPPAKVFARTTTAVVAMAKSAEPPQPVGH